MKEIKLKEHILIIDSNTQELRKMRELLYKEGFNIMTASDLKTANDLIEKIEIKYVISESSVFSKIQSLNKKNP